MKPTRSARLNNCPKCGEELIDCGLDKDTRHYEKQCPKCNRTFRRMYGYGHYWKEIGVDEY